MPLHPPEALQLVIPPSVVHLNVTGPLVARVVLSIVKEVMVGPQILVPVTGWPQFVVQRVSKQVLAEEQIPLGMQAGGVGVPPPPPGSGVGVGVPPPPPTITTRIRCWPTATATDCTGPAPLRSELTIGAGIGNSIGNTRKNVGNGETGPI